MLQRTMSTDNSTVGYSQMGSRIQSDQSSEIVIPPEENNNNLQRPDVQYLDIMFTEEEIPESQKITQPDSYVKLMVVKPSRNIFSCFCDAISSCCKCLSQYIKLGCQAIGSLLWCRDSARVSIEGISPYQDNFSVERQNGDNVSSIDLSDLNIVV